MKLNPDCIRDLMLELEARLSIEAYNDIIYRFKAIKVYELAWHMEEKHGYSREDTVYSALQLWESGYIATNREPPAYGHLDAVEIGGIIYITPSGHDFISNIHDKKTWSKKIKPILRSFGDVSLSVITAVSKGVASAAIEKLLLNPPAAE